MEGIIGVVILLYIAGYLYKTYTVQIYVIGSIIAVVWFLLNMKKMQRARDFQRQQEEETRKQRDEIRKQEEETRKRQEEARNKEEEIRKRLIEEDKKYDRVINCPMCNGFGETYIQKQYYRYIDEEETSQKTFRRTSYWIISGDVKCKKWVEKDLDDLDKEWVFENYKGECPHCRKTGSVYAWFEKNAVLSKACKKCNKSGKLRIKEKLDIGIAEKEINCDNCKGTGKVVYSGELVHIKTKGGWYKEQLLENEEELYENEEFYQGKDVPNYRKFYVTITNKNRDFFSKSQPRQL